MSRKVRPRSGLVRSYDILFMYCIMKYPKNIQNRIKRIEGQVKGVKRMMIEEESNTKVMTQLQAVISSLESMKMEMVKQQMKESIVSDVKKTLGIEE